MNIIVKRWLQPWAAIASITLVGATTLPYQVRSENSQMGINPTANHAQILSQAQGGLIGRSWQLVGWGDPEGLESPLPDTEITLGFAKRRVSGSSGCNFYQATYSTTNDRIEFGPIAATRKLCAENISQQEFRYLSLLEQVKTYTINADGQLRLTYRVGEVGGVLVFEPK